LRGFSAPVKLTHHLSFEQKIFLVKHDTDSFSRWDNAQSLWLSLIMDADAIDEVAFFDALEFMMTNIQDKSLICALLTLPSERALHNHQAIIDVFAIHHKREQVIQKIIQHFKPLLLKLYQSLNTPQTYDITPESVGRRALKNLCLFYLAKDGELSLAQKQFNSADCMSDKLVAFKVLINGDTPYRTQALTDFYQEFKDDTQVMDKYFSTQALSNVCDIDKVTTLMQHELFCFNTPNRLRSVVGSFTHNTVNFHHQAGYAFLTNVIIKLNTINPQIGARLVATYNHWRRFTPELKALQKQQLKTILATKNLSLPFFINLTSWSASCKCS
jgi:aminopeptidase N